MRNANLIDISFNESSKTWSNRLRNIESLSYLPRFISVHSKRPLNLACLVAKAIVVHSNIEIVTGEFRKNGKLSGGFDGRTLSMEGTLSDIFLVPNAGKIHY